VGSGVIHQRIYMSFRFAWNVEIVTATTAFWKLLKLPNEQNMCPFPWSSVLIWNSIPLSVRNAPATSTFKRRLKTFYFSSISSYTQPPSNSPRLWFEPSSTCSAIKFHIWMYMLGLLARVTKAARVTYAIADAEAVYKIHFVHDGVQFGCHFGQFSDTISRHRLK